MPGKHMQQMQQHQDQQGGALQLPASPPFSPDALYLSGVLEHILRFLPQDCRLPTCSLVCTGWRAAALSVTAEAGVSAPGSAALLAWLRLHGSNVKSLDVQGGILIEHSSLAGLQQLTRLEVEAVPAQPALLSTVGDNLQNLKHLRLNILDWGPLISTASRNELSLAASRLWEGCRGLTYLEATGCDLDDRCVTSLGGSLQQLRSLDLSNNAIMDPHSLAGLPPCMTSLKIGNNSRNLDATAVLSSSSSSSATIRHTQGDELGADAADTTSAAGRAHVNSRVAFPELRALGISGLYMSRPEVLEAFSMLTWLDLRRSYVEGTGEVLAVLPGLQQLRYLNLKACNSITELPGTIAALRSALSLLTQLTALDIGSAKYSLDVSGLNAPAGGMGAQQATTAGCLFDGVRLPRLLELRADDMCCADGESPLWGGNDLKGLAAAFPAVRELHIDRSLRLTADGTELQPLVALAGSLTCLHLDAVQQLHDQHMQSLAELRGLSHLKVLHVGPHISDRGIVGLSALVGLTLLQLVEVTSAGVSTEVLACRHADGRGLFGDRLVLTTTRKHGAIKATVSQQLIELAAKSPQMWKETQQKLTEELKSAQKAARDAKKEAAAERRKTASAQKQARKAQKQAAAVEQQLATSQDQVQALQEQLAALQLQLQEAVSASQ